MKEAIYGLLSGSGLPALLHRLLWRRKVSILTYHAVVSNVLPVRDVCFMEERLFRRQMEYLKNHFDVRGLRDAFREDRPRGERPVAVLTFDDGFQNVFDVAFPILRRLELPAAVFLATGYVGTGDAMWFCRINRALSETRKEALSWRGRVLDIADAGKKAAVSAFFQEELKTEGPDELARSLEELFRALEVNGAVPVREGSPYRMLSRAAVEEMARSGLVEFGAHTRSHSILARLGEAERREEICASVASVAGLTGKKCEYFAYPNGRNGDFSEQDVAILKEQGVRYAVTTVVGGCEVHDDPMRLKRYEVDGRTDLGAFRVTVHHLKQEVKKLIAGGGMSC